MAVRELVSYYVAIEEYYMEHAVGKAIEIREASQGGLTTSLVDDAFFVLQKVRRGHQNQDLKPDTTCWCYLCDILAVPVLINQNLAMGYKTGTNCLTKFSAPSVRKCQSSLPVEAALELVGPITS